MLLSDREDALNLVLAYHGSVIPWVDVILEDFFDGFEF